MSDLGAVVRRYLDRPTQENANAIFYATEEYAKKLREAHRRNASARHKPVRVQAGEAP